MSKRTARAANINHGRLKKLAISSFRHSTSNSELSHKLDALREETQRLESIYQRKLAALEALKKSLLHQAFSGQL